MEYTDEQKDLIEIIKKSYSRGHELTNRDVVILYHWINHINDPEFAWVPNEYKKDMPQYRGK